ncbi:MAG TPA: biotin/lipoyl-containing protein [Candidatus Polarisedimenticolia bacterium]|nr:biotin/lipoyl-containing protein [Candidatus Polarisedimenticolia bacterium]
MRYVARVGEREFRIEVAPQGSGRFSVSLDGRSIEVERRGEGVLMSLTIDGQEREAVVVRDSAGAARAGSGSPRGQGEAAYGVSVGGRPYDVRLLDPLRRKGVSVSPQAGGPIDVRAIMPGKITALLVNEGQEVRSGQGVIVVEAMKMENELPAPKDGRVRRIRVRPGETVEAGAVLFTVE